MLVILTTHPIQYQVPIWQELARRSEVPFEVWYMSDHGARPALDPGFGAAFQWDLDMLEGYPHAFLPMRPRPHTLASLRRAWIDGLRTRLRERRVKALWIQGWQVPAYWQAALTAHQLGIPVWLRGESNDLHRRPGVRGSIHGLALRSLFARVSHFLYIGTANRELYRRLGVPESLLVPAPYCVDNGRFASAADALRPRRDLLRDAWNIPPAAACFLFAGKLIPSKRPLDVLHAVERVLSMGTLAPNGIHVLVVGEGELLPEARREAARLAGLAGRPIVTFAGFLNQTEIPAAYVAADWLVLPSDAHETWGLVVNEALACGTPAIVSDLCGCARDLVAPLDPRLVYRCEDLETLSTMLIAVLTGEIPNPGAARCRAIVSAFDVSRTVDSVTALYGEIAGRPVA